MRVIGKSRSQPTLLGSHLSQVCNKWCSQQRKDSSIQALITSNRGTPFMVKEILSGQRSTAVRTHSRSPSRAKTVISRFINSTIYLTAQSIPFLWGLILTKSFSNVTWVWCPAWLARSTPPHQRGRTKIALTSWSSRLQQPTTISNLSGPCVILV